MIQTDTTIENKQANPIASAPARAPSRESQSLKASLADKEPTKPSLLWMVVPILVIALALFLAR